MIHIVRNKCRKLLRNFHVGVQHHLRSNILLKLMLYDLHHSVVQKGGRPVAVGYMAVL